MLNHIRELSTTLTFNLMIPRPCQSLLSSQTVQIMAEGDAKHSPFDCNTAGCSAMSNCLKSVSDDFKTDFTVHKDIARKLLEGATDFNINKRWSNQ